MSRMSKIRSLLSVLLTLTILIVGVLSVTNTAKAINTPWLHVQGNLLKDPSGNTVILRGVDLTDLAVVTKHGKTAPQLIDLATDSAQGWYAHVVRLAVYPDAIDQTAGWNANPDAYFNTYLNPAINECVARQIYCIIDWHYITDYSSGAVNTATTNFWNYVAPRYANTPNVIFELYNEPTTPNNWSTWKSTAQPWVNLIRAAAPNNIILIGSPQWSQTTNNAASSPFSGSNLMYVVHIYPQHGGQSTWDSWVGNTSNTVPYFITEYGWQNGGGNPTSGTTSGFGVPFENYLDSKGLSSTAWVFDTIWQPIMFDANWNLLGGDNYMGQQTQQYLFNHRNDNLPPATNTPVGPTPTRTNTPAVTNTPAPTATSGGSGGSCSPVSATISAPFTKDGSGTFCWQSNNLGSYINSWNLASLTVNGVNFTNIWVGNGSLPAQIGGYWYVSYNSSVAWGHFEAK